MFLVLDAIANVLTIEAQKIQCSSTIPGHTRTAVNKEVRNDNRVKNTKASGVLAFKGDIEHARIVTTDLVQKQG